MSPRLPAAGEARRTLVLVAHHDAAHNGAVWHPRVLAANRRWSHRTGRTVPSRGSGGHLVLARREGLTGRMARLDVGALLRIASAAGIDLRPAAFPNVCDATIARHSRMRAATLLSYSDGWVGNLHLRTDAPEAIGRNTDVCAPR